MSAIYWLSAINGSFTNPSEWSGGIVPGATDDAIIDAVGAAPYTVSASGAETVNSLQTGAQATVAMSHATFTATEGSGAGVDAGVILVGTGATFAASGTVDNSGLIQLGSGKGADALVADGALTLSGGGRVFMTDSEQNQIGGGKGASLTNLDNTILGSGIVGSKFLTVTNSANGVVDATGALALEIDSFTVNDGLLEATGKGGLHVDRVQIDNGVTGIVLADDSTVLVEGGSVYGGTLESVGSGAITLTQGKLRAVTNADKISVAGYSTWEDGLVNHGTITLGLAGYRSRFLGDTLTGGGSVYIALGADLGVAVNVDNTITGSGMVQAGNYGGLVLSNGALGIIDADATGSLLLDATTITNAGLMESAGVVGSGSYLRVVATDLVNTGTIVSTSAVADMMIQPRSLENAGLIASTGMGGASLTGGVKNTGVLSVSGGGTMSVSGKVAGAGQVLIDDATLIFASTFSQNVTFTGGTGELELGLSESFTRTIAGFSATGATSLDLGDISFVGAGEATFSGNKQGGVLTVTDGLYTARINLEGDYRRTTFVASSDGDHGTIVVAEPTPLANTLNGPPHTFIAAMAGLGASPASAMTIGGTEAVRDTLLTSPRHAIA